MTKLKTTGPIHDTLTGYDFTVDEPLTPRKAIRYKCLECCGGDKVTVRQCDQSDCPNWPWRSGRLKID